MLTKVMHKIQSVLTQQTVQKNLGWMNTLPEMSEIDALKQTTSELAKIKFDGSKNIKNQLEMVLEIDEKTNSQAKKLTHNYLIILKINKEKEAEIFETVYLYQRQLFLAYAQFLEAYEAQKKALLSTDRLNHFFCRLLNATFSMAKWRYFDDQPAPVGTWATVYKVIKYAEKLSILNKNLFLYNHQRREVSIATLLKQGFMMDTLHKGNYSRLQIQLTEQILKTWASNPVIVSKFKPNLYHFYVNIEEDRGPDRVRTVEKFAQYRFWRTSRLVDLIEAYLCAVDTQKSLDAFNLDKIAPASVIIKLFKKLRVDWCVEGYERQRRKEARNKSAKLLNVSYGIEDICGRILREQAKNHVDEVTDEDFALNVARQRKEKTAPNIIYNSFGSENWWLVDQSSKGFAVDLGKDVSSWIEPGKIVGYTDNSDNAFVIAEIKNVRKQRDGTYRAGLLVLSNQGAAVKMARLDQNINTEALSGYFVNDSLSNFDNLHTFFGLMLPKNDKINALQNTLIIPRSQYKRGSKYQLDIDGKEKIFTIGSPLAKQRDWVSVTLPERSE
jgi:hypothetical protein